ncbi:MAG: hypothetical protein BWY09_02750 [Candidatus Hydrogenedentes bacterium ADurb.Bin179]|nr:MAG: hypothetical protein BWY09_02750 [Candidatus Hydrogenedentes bacterium ADurb.Bin179]
MTGSSLKGAVFAITASATAVKTSMNMGSPAAPGSLVRSSTATVLTEGGNAFINAAAENGRYRRTITPPIFSPFAARYSMVSVTASAADPMTTITRSASGAPT